MLPPHEPHCFGYNLRSGDKISISKCAKAKKPPTETPLRNVGGGIKQALRPQTADLPRPEKCDPAVAETQLDQDEDMPEGG